MQKKIKCIVCGQRFHVDKSTTYDVEEPHGITEILAGGARVLTAIDCPACGCQNRLGERWPAASDAPDDEAEDVE